MSKPLTHDGILARTERRPNGCLVWLGTRSNGYGRIKIGGRNRMVHAVVWEHHHGAVPEGYELDHDCHNRDPICPGGHACEHRACIEITHLRLATRSENNRAGARAARTGTCRNGHPLEGNRTKDRRCRTCRNAQANVARNARLTHCPRGHPYSEANTFLDALGRRMCLICLHSPRR